MKKGLHILMAFILLLSSFGGTIASADDSTIITTGEEFAVTVKAGGSYRIEGQEVLPDGSYGIVLPENYEPLVNFSGSITGTLGKNNIYLQGTDLIQSAAAGNTTIKDINLKGKDITFTDADRTVSTTGVAALISTTLPRSVVTLENVANYVNVTYTASANQCWGIGGLIGCVNAGSVFVSGCRNYGNITSNTYSMAGIVAYMRNTIDISEMRIESSYNYGKILNISTENIYRIAGIYGGAQNMNHTKQFVISGCGNYGDVSGSPNGTFSTPSGIADYARNTRIERCFNIGSISGATAAGIAGAFQDDKCVIANCFNAGMLTSVKGDVFGIVNPNKKVEVSNCYNVGGLNASGSNYAIGPNVSNGTTYENAYYIELPGITYKDGAGIKLDPDMLEGLEGSLSAEGWELVSVEGAEAYPYPQLKGNTLYYDYQFFDTMPVERKAPGLASREKGTITADGWTVTDGVRESVSIYAPEKKGYAVSEKDTYPALIGASVIQPDFEDNLITESVLKEITLDKSAQIILATDKDPQYENLPCIVEGGFTPIVNEESGETETVLLKCGKRYYLSEKTVTVEKGKTESFSLYNAANLTAMYGIFVRWLDNASVTINSSENAEILLGGAAVTENLQKTTAAGKNFEISVAPKNGYYIKSIKVNGEVQTENQLEEYHFVLHAVSDSNIEINIEKYNLSFSYFDIARSTNPDETIYQTFVIEGNAKSFMMGSNIEAVIYDEGNSISEKGSAVISEEGGFRIEIPFNHETADYNIKIGIPRKIENIELDASYQIFRIPSVQSINALLTELNTAKDSINQNDLRNKIINDSDLKFETSVFKMTKAQNKILSAFLAFDGKYTVDNIYRIFDEACIFNALNAADKTAEVEKILTVYGEKYIKLNESPLYSSALKVRYDKMIGCIYEDYSDILDQFEFAVVWEQMKEVKNHSGIYAVLNREENKTALEITDIITALSNMTDSKIRVICEYLQKNLDSMKNTSDLLEKLNYGIENSDKLLKDKQSSSISSGGTGSSGSGSNREVTISNELTKKEDLPSANGSELLHSFGDLQNVSWAKEGIEHLFQLGVLQGKEPGKFCPNDNITRSEFTKTLVLAFDLYNENAQADFTDITKNDWCYSYVASARANGIVNGKNDGSFGKEENITREDAAVMIIRAVYRVSKHEKLESRKDAAVAFSDADSISQYAKTAVSMLSGEGLLNGYEDGSFQPQNNATRAEAAVIIYNVIRYIAD